MKFRAVGAAFARATAAKESVILITIACLPAMGHSFYLRDKVSWQSAIPASQLVTVDQARAWGDTAIWVDARPDDEFAKDHVPGAISLNEDHWDDLFPVFRDRWSPEKRIVVYCSAESCNLARDVARKLREEDQLPNDIRVLQGGWEEWKKVTGDK